MPTNSPAGHLTGKEAQLLRLLWDSEKSLTASEITEIDPGLNIHTVYAALRSLLKKGLLEVAEVVFSGTVLCRSYRPTALSAKVILDDLATQCRVLSKKMPASSVFVALVENERGDEEAIQILEEMLAMKKKSLREG